nr:immunoglobulin light chain junction region [Macaca mulatta]
DYYCSTWDSSLTAHVLF